MAAAARFYDAVLATIGMRCALCEPHERGHAGADGNKLDVSVDIHRGRADESEPVARDPSELPMPP